jgi:hypothetical protein
VMKRKYNEVVHNLRVALLQGALSEDQGTRWSYLSGQFLNGAN